jgi:hypothetical protein
LEERNAYRILVEKPERKGLLRRPRLGGRIILGWILEKWHGVLLITFIGVRIGTSGGLL